MSPNHRLFIAALLGLSLNCLPVLHAGAQVFIPFSSSIGSVPTEAGTGLDGFFYRHPDGNDLRFLTDAEKWVARNAPMASFRASTLWYGDQPVGDTIADVLRGDAASLSPLDAGTEPPQRPAAVFHFTGAIAITEAMDIDPSSDGIDVRFGLSSDDASLLRIGGVSVVRAARLNLGEFEPNTERGYYDASEFQSIATFGAAGLYPVEMTWFDWYGGISLNAFTSIAGGLDPGYTPFGFAGILPTEVLYGGAATPFAGGSQDNPLLPTVTEGGTFVFDNVETDLWFDPATADGYEFSTTDGSLFTRIITLPVGFASPFTVSSGGVILGQYFGGQGVDFVSLFGSGVSSFIISGINPEVDGTDPTAFPIQLAFDAPRASFTMTAVDSVAAVPEPGAVAFGLLSAGSVIVLIVRKRRA